jgi:hypothetical protein
MIRDLSLRNTKRQSRLLDRGERNAPWFTALWPERDCHLLILLAYREDFSFQPAAIVRRQHACPSTNEAPPLVWRPQWTLTGRRHFQHIPVRHENTTVQPTLERARCTRTVVDGHLLPIATIYSNLQNRSRLAASLP